MKDLSQACGSLPRCFSLAKQWKALVIMLMLCVVLPVHAQNITVTGTVEDSSGEPLIGATILVDGTKDGTSTDIEGNFTLKNVSPKAILKVSYVGYATQSVKIDGRTEIKIVLKEDSETLDELVVVGYGTMKKKDLTGAVSTVKGSDLLKMPTANVAQAMTGRLAGVQITTTDGSPDAEMVIRVRGGGSITGDNSPLYIVDGFPVSSISDINPADIADITVLKDASSTAIYGSQGANGVILITTKSPEGGKTTVSYSGFMQGKHINKKIKAMDPYDYVMFNYERAALQGNSAISAFEKRYGQFSDLDLYLYQDGADLYEDAFNNHKLSQNHQVSISGGSDKTKFSVSAAYVDDQALIKDQGYSRFNITSKIQHMIAKNLRFEFGTRMSDTNTKGVGTSGLRPSFRSYDLVTKAPVNGLLDQVDEATINQMDEDEYESYLSQTQRLGERAALDWKRRHERRFHYDAAINWNIIPSLTYRPEIGYDYTFRDTKSWWDSKSSTAVQNGGSLPMGTWEKRNDWKLRLVHTLTFTKDWGENAFNAMIGQEFIKNNYELNTMDGKYFVDGTTPEKMFAAMQANSGATGSRLISSTLGKEDRTLSYFGRINYNYGGRYYATFTMRADGSSKFAKGNRWGYFPAGSVAWRISEEKFMEAAQEWLSNLKLRASYGSSGNNRIGSALFETLYKNYSSSKFYGAGNIQNPHWTLNNSQLANPGLKWETTITRNIGLDFGFFNERLSGSLEFYWNSVKDLLLNRSITAIGYTTMQQNIGKTSNKGVELQLNAIAVSNRDFQLTLNANIAYNQNRVDKLADADYFTTNSGAFSTDMRGADDYRVIVGQPLGLVWGFVHDGVYGVDDFQTYVDDAGHTQFLMDGNKYILKDGVVDNSFATTGSAGGLRPGAPKYKDLNGDGTIDADNDRQIIGRTQPKFTGGFGLNATWKGFDFSAMFNFVVGNDVYNMDKIVTTQQYRNEWSNLRDFMGASSAWTYLDRTTGTLVSDYETLKAMNEGKEYWSALTMSGNNPIATSWAVEDGSYLRLQTLTLGYTFPQKWTKKFACNQLRLYCTLNNVATICGYSGYDPEVSSAIRGSSYNGLTPGADFSAYPKAFSWTAGVNITF